MREVLFLEKQRKHGCRKSVSLKEKKKSLDFCSAGLAVDLVATVTEILATWLWEMFMAEFEYEVTEGALKQKNGLRIIEGGEREKTDKSASDLFKVICLKDTGCYCFLKI